MRTAAVVLLAATSGAPAARSVAAASPASAVRATVFAEDFEDGQPGAWNPQAGVHRMIVAAPGGNGKCLRVHGRERGAWYYLWGPKFAMRPGRNYRVTARLLVTRVSPRQGPGLRVEFIASGRRREIGRVMTTTYGLAEGGWQTLICQFVCPQGVNGGWIVLQKQNVAVEIDAYLDDVRVVEVEGFEDPGFVPGDAAERGHPRLFFTRRDLAALRTKTRSPVAGPHFERLKQTADRALARPLVKRTDPWRSRQVLDIIPPCAFMYLMTGEKKYAQRAKREILATDTWPDWEHPAHRSAAPSDLATGETCLAVGCGYDWLSAYLTAEERATIRDILLRRGIRPYLATIRARMGWAHWPAMNWTSVLNGGVGVGALAIYDEEPEAAAALAYASKDIRRIVDAHVYGRDGGYNEGVMYWHYGTYYLTLFAQACQSALGDDAGLLDADRVRRSVWFPIYFTAPDGIIANFSDAYDTEWSRGYGTVFAGLFASLGRGPDWASTRDAYLWWADHGGGERGWAGSVFAFLWRPKDLAPTEPPALDRAKRFAGVGWAVLRSEPVFKPRVYLAFKSGDLGANHTNYDLNSFILAAHGERLTCDPGYGILGTEHHSTVLVNGKGQQKGSRGTIVHCGEGNGYLYLLGDASEAYGGAITGFRRHVVFVGDGRSIVIVDELAAETASTFQWMLHARRPIHLDEPRRSATVVCASAQLAVSPLLPANASLALRQGRDRVLEITNPEKRTRALFVTALGPHRRGAPPFSARAERKDGEVVILTRCGGTADRVRFRVTPPGEGALLSVNGARWAPTEPGAWKGPAKTPFPLARRRAKRRQVPFASVAQPLPAGGAERRRPGGTTAHYSF